MLFFKISGLLLIFFACSAAGLLKANTLKKRADKLSLITRSLASLSERIRSDGGEIAYLLPKCFKASLLSFENSSPVINESFLESQDISLLNEFFEELGMRERQGEFERTEGFAALFKSLQSEAEEKNRRLSKLYSTSGMLLGLSVCIFLI